MPANADESRVRISCASLCRIQIEGQYLLLLNKNRRQKGIYQLSPVGGALEVDDWSALSEFTFEPEDPASRDLRLSLNVEQLDQFRQWFYARQDRETSPFRELYEELVQESGVLYSLSRDDVAIKYIHTVEDSKQTLRKGLTGQFTYYFFEIYAVSFRTVDVLLRLKSPPSSAGVVLLDEAQARQAEPLPMTFDGAERQVTLNTQYLFAEGAYPPHEPPPASP